MSTQMIISTICTILMCISSILTIKTANKQIYDAEWHFAEQRRLELMPYFQINPMLSPSYVDGEDYIPLTPLMINLRETNISQFFQVKNIGYGIARNVKYSLSNIPQYKGNNFRILSLPKNNSRIIKFTFLAQSETQYELNLKFAVTYDDLLGNHYTQDHVMLLSISPTNISFKHIYEGAPTLILRSKLIPPH